MAEETPNGKFTEAMDSLRNIVRNELALIDLDAKFRTNLDDLSEEDFKAGLENLSEQEKQIFAEADEDKRNFLLTMRSKLETMISEIAELRRPLWKKVKFARGKKIGNEGEKLKAIAEEEAESLRTGVGRESASAPSACPPGFVLVDGICVPI